MLCLRNGNWSIEKTTNLTQLAFKGIFQLVREANGETGMEEETERERESQKKPGTKRPREVEIESARDPGNQRGDS